MSWGSVEYGHDDWYNRRVEVIEWLNSNGLVSGRDYTFHPFSRIKIVGHDDVAVAFKLTFGV
jgi:hypothetical protein